MKLPQESLEELLLRKQMIRQNYMFAFPDRRIPNDELECVWVLSTGRCGTKTVADLLALSPQVFSFHEPQPRIWKLVNEGYQRRGEQRDGALDVVIDAVRRDIIEIANCYEFLYTESNHRFVFFAHELARVFPRSRFIFLYRDMDAVVKSALTRGWYTENDLYKDGRPHPKDGIERDRGQLLAWYWCETNEYILDFLSGIKRDRWRYLPFNDIDTQRVRKIQEIYEWLKVLSPPDQHIWDILKAKLNASPWGCGGRFAWPEYGEREEKIYDGLMGARRVSP